MRKVILYCATSLNGKIARTDGKVDWLDAVPNPENTDYGYKEFYAGIDATIMGFNTYELLLSWGVDFPYPDKKNYVLSNKQGLENTEFVEFITENQTEFIKNLKGITGKDIWLIGGGQTNTNLLNQGLIDEMIIHVMPIIIPDGIELFEQLPDETQFRSMDQKAYTSGVVELKYSVISAAKR